MALLGGGRRSFGLTFWHPFAESELRESACSDKKATALGAGRGFLPFGAWYVSVGCFGYFHSQTLMTVFPSASTLYSWTPTAPFRLANFSELVWK